MSDPTKPEPPGSPFPSGGPPPPAGSPFPSGPSQNPYPPQQNQNPYSAQNPYAAPDVNIRKSQGWGWNPLIGITYNGFPVGIVVVVVFGLIYLASK